jgi:hypothetical protein
MEAKERKNSWRKVGQEKAKQVDICTERKRETGNNGLWHKKRRENEKSKNKDKKIVKNF